MGDRIGRGTPSTSGGHPPPPGPPSVQDLGSNSGSGPSPATPSASTPTAAPSQQQQLSKRRRGLGVVTPNACTECRKKRAKQDAECVYEVPVKQSKEHLRTEIENLRRYQRSSDHVLSALSHGDLWEEVLKRLRGGQSVDTVSDWLENILPTQQQRHQQQHQHQHPQQHDPKSAPLGPMQGFSSPAQGPYPQMSGLTMGHSHSVRQANMNHSSPWGYSSLSQSDSHPDMMNWTPQQSRVGSWVEGLSQDQQSEGNTRYRGVDQILYSASSSPMKVPASAWTNVTADPQLVEHLLTLYFCWEYPTFASLSKEHFLRDFQEGSSRFCSPILVNALLALGCRFSSAPNTRADPNDPYSSGDHFFRESLRLFNEEQNHHSLTTIQALGIMSIREASCGRDSESWFYAGQSIRLAIEMGLHRMSSEGNEDEVAVKSATFWGAFALDHAWSLATGSLPQCSCFPILPPKPAIIDDIEASLWVPYTDDGAPLQRSCEQPSNVRSVYKCFCELSELVHQSLYVLHSPGRPLSSRDLLNIYTQYLNCMYYHFAILLLFRPLIKLRIIGSSISPRDVCTQAADAIQGLLRSYSQLYTLRRTPSFVPYFVLTSAIMHLAVAATTSSSLIEASIGMSLPSERAHQGAPPPASEPSPAQQASVKIEPRVSESINQGIADLTEMAPCHHFAEQALNILCYLAKKWHIDVEINVVRPEDHDRSVRPYTSSLNLFTPNVAESDFTCSWGGGGGGVSGGPVAQSAASRENPLFWPFPLQGRPMLPSGRMLEDAGFEII
ncbi:hypothetical protein MKZ38_009147 [Zalerion maritima]|uniref:Xylanolytic transcriptional activator regulatory domain-containing protein n=1 Tax=Zalerion maritima TaxID=339359 RepID=A0AAD5RTK3_9PEZI|nr:hypothetical protein MKZ38_009147 [Zalerion maritima]